MNILLISSMQSVGGTERATQQIAEFLLKDGHSVHLLCTDGPLVSTLADRKSTRLNSSHRL